MHLSPMMFNSSPEDVCMVSKLIFGIFFFNIAIIRFLFSFKLSYSLFHFFLQVMKFLSNSPICHLTANTFPQLPLPR